MNARALLIATACGLAATGARADLIEIRYQGFLVRGDLSNQVWFYGNTVFTAIADTSTREVYPGGYTMRNVSMNVSLPGVGTFDFLSGTRSFVSNLNQRAGFGREDEEGVNTGHDLFHGPVNAQFATWDMTTPIGPVQGWGRFLQWVPDEYFSPIHTTGGLLTIYEVQTTSVVTATVVPEPATFVLVMAAPFFARRRSRKPA